MTVTHLSWPTRGCEYRFQPPLSPVGHDQKVALPARVRPPLESTAKPWDGLAPTSHWNWPVGGVRMHPRPLPSVRPVDTCQWGPYGKRCEQTLTAVVDAEGARGKTGLADTVLAIGELSDDATRSANSTEPEAALESVSNV